MTLTREQIRHARAMSRKIKEHAERIVAEMDMIENASYESLQHNFSLLKMTDKFSHDAGYGVLDRTQAIDQVVTDMLGGFNTTGSDDPPEPLQLYSDGKIRPRKPKQTADDGFENW